MTATELLTQLPPHTKVAGGAILLLGLIFLLLFVLPAARIGWRLRRLIRALAQERLTGPVDLSVAFEGTGVLDHLWKEFRETLHEERTMGADGREAVARLRATQPAAQFFTEQTIVDTPVRAEFFKHLPGILTSIGIIGTFLGLILGLGQFDVAVEPKQLSQNLKRLMDAVSGAFMISFAAIALAVLITAIEKWLLVHLYKQTESLTQAIDEHFRTGISEEYLARLVTASEQTDSQMRVLKDALVSDLRDLLTDLVDRQNAATAASHARLGSHITESLTTQLSQPLAEISKAVGQVSRDQGSAVADLMVVVLDRFSERVEGMFGNQLTGIHQMQQETMEALRRTVDQLQQMSSAIEGAGKRAAEEMSTQLLEALRKLESRQQVMNEEMRKFVQDLRSQVMQTQSETTNQVLVMLTELQRQSGALVSGLSASSQAHVAAMGDEVGKVVHSIDAASQQIARAVDRLEAVTSDAVGRMNVGADRLADAATDFATASTGVGDALNGATTLSRQLAESAGAVSTASKSLEGVVAEYRANRDGIGQLLDVLKSAVDGARREVVLTSDVLARLESAAGRLATAQREADEYLGKVTGVLEEAHAAFAKNLTNTLGKANTEFYDSLRTATKLLREAINELETTLGSLPPNAGLSSRGR